MNQVEFPKLGLSFNISKVAFKIGSFPVYWYGIIIGLALGLSVFLALRAAKKNNISKDLMIDVSLFGMIAAIVGARLYYVAFSGNFKGSSFFDIINIRNGGLAIYGAVIGALISTIFVAKVHKVSFVRVVDFCIPYLALGQAIGRWGNFFNQEAFGSTTNLPWGMKSQATVSFLTDTGFADQANKTVHPTFLYESLLCFALFFTLIWIRNHPHKRGVVFATYMFVYGLGRALIEKLRTDSLMLFDVKVSEYLALFFAIAGIVVIFYLRKHGKVEDYELVAEAEEKDDVSDEEGEIFESDQTSDETEEIPEKEEPLEEETEEQTEEKSEERSEDKPDEKPEVSVENDREKE